MSEHRMHEIAGEELQDWVDGRLEEERSRVVELHVAACPSCGAEVAALRAVKRALAATATANVEPPPPSLAADLRRALDGEDRAFARRRRPAAAWGLAAAAVLVVAVAAGLWWTVLSGREDLASTVAQDLRRFASGELALAYPTSEPAALEAFFRDRGAPAGRVFDFGMMGYGLAGGSAWELAGRDAALFVYGGVDRRDVLCIMYRGTAPPAAEVTRRHQGIDFHVFHRGETTLVFWQEGSIACVLASDAAPEQVIQLAFAKAVRV